MSASGKDAPGVIAPPPLIYAVFLVLEHFHKIGTTAHVYKPATAGPYRITRNPMYLALSLLYLGIGLMTGGIWVLGLIIPAVVTMNLGVIAREERYLERKFGPAYLSYKTSVRRWL